jgi:hypothetical protein
MSIGFCAGRAVFNAISFLIAIPGKVSKMYDTLGDLFDKLCLSEPVQDLSGGSSIVPTLIPL